MGATSCCTTQAPAAVYYEAPIAPSIPFKIVADQDGYYLDFGSELVKIPESVLEKILNYDTDIQEYKKKVDKIIEYYHKVLLIDKAAE